MYGPTRATACIWSFRDARNMRWPGCSLMSGRCPHPMRAISRRLSRVTPGGNAGRRGIVFERCKPAFMDQLQPSTHVDTLSGIGVVRRACHGVHHGSQRPYCTVLAPFSRGATVAPPWHAAAALQPQPLLPLAFPEPDAHVPLPPRRAAEVIELPGERLHVLRQVRPGLGLRQALPPLLPGRVQRLVSLVAGLLHRLPAHTAQGSGTLLLGPEQHRIPPRIVRCLVPHIPEPLLVLGVPPDLLGCAAGLLHAQPAHGPKLPGVREILHALPEDRRLGLRLPDGLACEITAYTIIMLDTDSGFHGFPHGGVVPYQGTGGIDGGELCRHVHGVGD